MSLFIPMLVLGLVTSVHCVAMCGPLVLTYAVKGEVDGPWYRRMTPNAAYQAAKILSYMTVGLVLGFVGSAFNLAGIRGYVMLGAAVFMILLGLSMTGWFPGLRILTPKPPKFLIKALMKLRKRANAEADAGDSTLMTPIMFGLITGLMPCAPLINAQLVAAASGSAITGAIGMFAFGLGTAPLMFAFGTASGLLTAKVKDRMMTVLAVVVIVFGAVMLNRGLMLLGSPLTFNTVKTAVLGTPATTPQAPTTGATASDGVTEVKLAIQNTQFVPATLQIPADKPVRLVVDRQEANACSDQIVFPQLGVSADLAPNATTVVNLPATKSGTFTMTCGMGMMSGQLVVGAAAASTGAAESATGISPIAIALMLALAGVAAYGFAKGRKRPAPACPAPAQASAATATAHAKGGKGSDASKGQTVSRKPSSTTEAGVAGEAPRILGLGPAELIIVGIAVLAAVLVGLAAGGMLG